MKFKNVFAIIVIFMATSLFALAQTAYVEVLYFHATIRCQGCLTIEDFTQKSINMSFADQLKSGKLKFKSLDFLEDANAHYMDDYKFDSQALILSKKVNGKEVKFKNLDKIWDYSSDFNKFKKYLDTEIKKFLNE